MPRVAYVVVPGRPHPVTHRSNCRDEDAALTRLRVNTGWLTGASEFITRLETPLGRRLTRQPAGRKPKQRGNT